jgi:hypothetical protein
MQDCGGALTAADGMLSTSAVAIFFSCSGATEFSVCEFDSVGSVCYVTVKLALKTVIRDPRFETGFSVGRMKLANVMTILLPSLEPSYRF